MKVVNQHCQSPLKVLAAQSKQTRYHLIHNRHDQAETQHDRGETDQRVEIFEHFIPPLVFLFLKAEVVYSNSSCQPWRGAASMQEHMKILGILNIIYGGLGVFAMIV